MPGLAARLSTLVLLPFVVVASVAMAQGTSDHDHEWLKALRAHDIKATGGLVNKVSNVDLAPADGRTALMLASKRGLVDLVRSLIKRGADVNANNSNGGTPLMYAAIAGNTDIGRMLIEDDADTKARGSNGWSPLMVAAAKGHSPFVRLLLENGADVNAIDVYGWTPLARASFEKRNEVVGIIVSVPGADIDARDDQGATALHHAASVGAIRIIELLLSAGANRNIKDFKELTPLDRARAGGYTEIVTLLGGQ